MNHSTYYTLQNTLYYNSLLSSQVYKIDTDNSLQIIELSPFKSRNETIPLDLIHPEPKISSILDRQLIFLSMLSATMSLIFLISLTYTDQSWAIPFSVLFLLTSIATAIASYNNKTTMYAYQFMDSNTQLFTLYESYTGNKQVEVFVSKLNKYISKLNEEQVTLNDKSLESEISNENKYSEFTKHLDFLYNHGAINDTLYNRIDTKINEIVFNISRKKLQTNIIYFPNKAS